MFIKTDYYVGFKMPDEYELMEQFKEDNDMLEWKEKPTTEYIYYHKTEAFYTNGEQK